MHVATFNFFLHNMKCNCKTENNPIILLENNHRSCYDGHKQANLFSKCHAAPQTNVVHLHCVSSN